MEVDTDRTIDNNVQVTNTFNNKNDKSKKHKDKRKQQWRDQVNHFLVAGHGSVHKSHIDH